MLVFLTCILKAAWTQSVQLSNPIAGQYSDYTFNIVPSTTPSNSATLVVTFPNTYAINSNINTVNAAIITQDAISITLGSITNWQSFQVTGLNNPQYNQTVTISLTLYDPTQLQVFNAQYQIQSDKIVQYFISFGSQLSNTKTYLNLTFLTNTNDIDQIITIFPFINPGATNQINMINADTQCLQNNISLLTTTLMQSNQIKCQFTSTPGSKISMFYSPINTLNIENVYSNIMMYTLFQGNFIQVMNANIQMVQIGGQMKTLDLISLSNQMKQMNNIRFLITPKLSYPLGSSIVIQQINTQQGSQILQSSLIVSPDIGIINVMPLYTNNQITLNNCTSISGPNPLSLNLSNFMNPIAQNILQFRVTVNYNHSQIESSTVSLQLSQFEIKQVTLTAQNLTYSAITIVTISVNNAIQYPSKAIIQIQTPKQLKILSCIGYQCTVQNNNIQIQNYFLAQTSISIQLLIQLQNDISCSDSFVLTIIFNDYIISQSIQNVQLCTQPTTFELNYFQPQTAQTNIQSWYSIQYRIPFVNNGSICSLLIPQQFQNSISNCSATLSGVNQSLIISNQYISIILEQGGQLIVNCKMLNQRSIQEYNYNMAGQISYKNQSIATQSSVPIINLNIPDIIQSIMISSNNLKMNSIANVAISFEYTLLPSDIIVITIPFMDVFNCTPVCSIQSGTRSSNITLTSTKQVNVYVRNPATNQNLSPFYVYVYNNDKQVAQGINFEGIIGPLIGTSTQFNISLSSQYLGDQVSLTLSFLNSDKQQGSSKASISIPQNFLSVYNLSCSSDSCYQQIENGNTQIQVTSLNGFQIGNNIIAFHGLQITAPLPQPYTYLFNLALQDQFGNVYSNSQNQFTFDILCSQKCSNCSGHYDQCTSCKTGTYLFQRQCVNKCPPHYYLTSNQTCSQCLTPSSCIQCNQTNPKLCVECIQPYILSNGFCLKSSEISANNTSINSNSIHDQRKQVFDGIPLLCIISGIFLILSSIFKILKQKNVIFMKMFWQLLSILELIACLIRTIRFALFDSMAYVFLSIGLLVHYCFQQIQNGYILTNVMRAYPGLSQRVKNQKALLYFSYYYQWKIFFRYVDQQDIKLYSDMIIMLRAQTTALILQVVILISYLKLSQDTLTIDDTVYSILLLIFQLTDRLWNQSETRKILPESEEQPKPDVEDQLQN